ncbi:MAG: DUF2845 domain-containing protein [Gammaproteobacteria bacterium]|nr:DUF2845 domain-containing protein [Gammaproteobacteria bacterium]
MMWRIGMGCCLMGVVAGISAQTDSMYCPQNHGYVALGMSNSDVLAACGQPTHIEKSKTPLEVKVPMTQLIYNSQGSGKAFYGVWTLPVGVTVGSTLEVDVVRNKVHSVRMNGAGNNAFSVCGGVAILVDDPVSKVYSACGNPSVVNDTYIKEKTKVPVYPETWTYAVPYQPSFELTFVNGQLQSIQ